MGSFYSDGRFVADNEPQRLLAQRLLSASPVFVPLVPGVSEACRNQSERFAREISDLSYWAFQSEYLAGRHRHTRRYEHAHGAHGAHRIPSQQRVY